MTEDFSASLSNISNDPYISNYFISNQKNIYNFVKLYIEVDKIISSSACLSSNIVFEKLDEIKNTLHSNTTQIQSLHNNFSNTQSNIISFIQNKLDSLSNHIKDTTNTDIKNMFLDMQKQLSTTFDSTNIRLILENFKDKIENLNSQKLNDLDRKSLDVMTNIQSTLLQSLDSHSITHKIASIETNLSNINEHFSSNSSKKGQLAEGILLNILTETFPDSEIIDTSHLPNSGDMQIIKDNKPTILIDSKNYASKTVPKRDLDKFYTDIQQNNCSGILCNSFGGIANKQHFEIDIVDKNILLFIHSHKYDSSVFQLALNIIYNMHEQLKDKQTDSIVINQKLYQNLKIEYNYYLQTFQHHLEIVKSNVNSLSQLSFTMLDNFFKRKAVNIDFKNFTCHLCGTGCKTDKILKTHIKKVHPTSILPDSSLPNNTSLPTNNID
jgi:hypothetical protein